MTRKMMREAQSWFAAYAPHEKLPDYSTNEAECFKAICLAAKIATGEPH
jgi:hypothetical protein